MRLLIKERGEGKTTRLIHTSEATGYPIVVKSKIEAHRIKDEAERMDCFIPMPITTFEIKDNHLRLNTPVLIDELTTFLDEALKAYLGTDVVCATISDAIKMEHDSKKKYEKESEIVNEEPEELPET